MLARRVDMKTRRKREEYIANFCDSIDCASFLLLDLTWVIGGIMNRRTIDVLFRAAEEFLVSLRIGDGFDEKKFEQLSNVLSRCKEEWSNSEYVPKLAVEILVDLFPLTEGCSYLYKEPQAQRIRDAALQLNDLIKDAVS